MSIKIKFDLKKLDKELLEIYESNKKNTNKLIENKILEVIENELKG